MPQFLQNFSIHLDQTFSKKMHAIHGYYEQYGEVSINDFKEGFIMSDQFWTIQNYKQQWLYAWEYLKKIQQPNLLQISKKQI